MQRQSSERFFFKSKIYYDSSELPPNSKPTEHIFQTTEIFKVVRKFSIKRLGLFSCNKSINTNILEKVWEKELREATSRGRGTLREGRVGRGGGRRMEVKARKFIFVSNDRGIRLISMVLHFLL